MGAMHKRWLRVVLLLAVGSGGCGNLTPKRSVEISLLDPATSRPAASEKVDVIYPGVWLSGMPDSEHGQTDDQGKVTLRVSMGHNPTIVVANSMMPLDREKLRGSETQEYFTGEGQYKHVPPSRLLRVKAKMVDHWW